MSHHGKRRGTDIPPIASIPAQAGAPEGAGQGGAPGVGAPRGGGAPGLRQEPLQGFGIRGMRGMRGEWGVGRGPPWQNWVCVSVGEELGEGGVGAPLGVVQSVCAAVG